MKTKSIIKRANPNSKAVKPVRWKPGSRMGKTIKPEGYRLRWCEDTPENISRKKLEGWEILNTTNFAGLGSSEYEKRSTDSNGNTSTVLKRNELIAMIIPEDLALEREAYFEQETRERTKDSLENTNAKKVLGKNVIHSITPDGSFVEE